MKKRILRITGIMVVFIFAFSINGMGGLVDDKIKTGNSEQKPEVNNANSSEPTVVEVTNSDTQLSQGGQSDKKVDTQLTPIEEATSVASGLMASGTTDKSVVMATLVSAGFEQTEAEIAFAKASTNNVLDNPTTKIKAGNTDQKIDTDVDQAVLDTTTDVEKETKPTISAKDRVAEGIKPKAKIKGKGLFYRIRSKDKNIYKQEADTTKTMLDEGYTMQQIAQGFAANKYDSKQTATIFKQSGVSSADAYDALSSLAEKKAEAAYNKDKPKGKFAKSKFAKFRKTESLNDKKQTAFKSVVNDLESAGYNVQQTVDTVVQDLKDSGMSAQETKDFINAKVADGKPRKKFKGEKFSHYLKARKKQTMKSYGNGEIALAKSMLNTGYSESAVSNAFNNGPQKYSKADTQLIVSEAQNKINNQSTNNIDNNQQQIQNDINKRNTNPSKI